MSRNQAIPQFQQLPGINMPPMMRKIRQSCLSSTNFALEELFFFHPLKNQLKAVKHTSGSLMESLEVPHNECGRHHGWLVGLLIFHFQGTCSKTKKMVTFLYVLPPCHIINPTNTKSFSEPNFKKWEEASGPNPVIQIGLPVLSNANRDVKAESKRSPCSQ